MTPPARSAWPLESRSASPVVGPTAVRLTQHRQIVLLRPGDVAHLVVAISVFLAARPRARAEASTESLRGSAERLGGAEGCERLRALARTLLDVLPAGQRRWVDEQLAARGLGQRG